MSSTFLMPVGTIIPMVSLEDGISAGWLLCNGEPYDTQVYPDLFKILKSSNTPNLAGFTLIGAGTISSEAPFDGTYPNLPQVGGEVSPSCLQPLITYGASFLPVGSGMSGTLPLIQPSYAVFYLIFGGETTGVI
ncbi:tail fiber protein [Undibacterium sp. RuTC16W]|uniref:tail fiber protein n=1 Tax=Undibacterium sp. RuTC16W TaxID=3413048 RepID=UPI003BF30099